MNDDSEKWQVIGIVWLLSLVGFAILVGLFQLFCYLMRGIL